MSKVVVIPLANGFEEIEAVSIIDILRRADIKVVIASIDGENIVKGGQGIGVMSEANLNDISAENIDMIVLPGGWDGTNILAECEHLHTLLKQLNEKNRLIGAICAAPYALHKAGVLSKNFTCYPSAEKKIEDASGYDSSKNVVVDGNIITSRGPGTSICFALEIVKLLAGDEYYSQLKSGLLADFCI